MQIKQTLLFLENQVSHKKLLERRIPPFWLPVDIFKTFAQKSE